MELTLGPVLFDWKKDALIKFYEEASFMPVDRVYMGEVTCERRKTLTVKETEEIGEMLLRRGKKVTVSTLAVISNEDELKLTRSFIELPFSVEANDASIFNMVDVRKKEVFAGPHIQSYNKKAVGFLKKLGIKRITFPVELPKDAIKENIEASGIDAELFAHGKLPLAFSWRCFTSRIHGLAKSGCKRHCNADPDGMEIKTLDGEKVFAINGTSVMSAAPVTLIEFIEELKTIGVGALRISPHYRHTKETAEIFRGRLDGRISKEESLKELRGIYGVEFQGGWYSGGAAEERVVI